MNANELMIGDWVYALIGYPSKEPKTKEPIKVDFLSDKLQVGDLRFAGELIEPIPLTEEILKANGIPETELKGFFQARNSRCTITIDFADVNIRGEVHSDTASFMMRFRYVHELQHALRSCGLNDLTDNFKVE